jgi:hypothetical protein
MKKILSILALVSFLVLPLTALANGTSSDEIDVMAALNRITNWLFTILVAVAGIAIVIAGYYFVTASGNPEQIAKARNFIYYALIGVVVALLGRGMIALVQTIVK